MQMLFLMFFREFHKEDESQGLEGLTSGPQVQCTLSSWVSLHCLTLQSN
jgi:hypothetical protein